MNFYFEHVEGSEDTIAMGETIGDYQFRHRGRDYGKSNQDLAAVGLKRIRDGWYEDVPYTYPEGIFKVNKWDVPVHKWILSLAGVLGRVGKSGSETFKFDPNVLSRDIIIKMFEDEWINGKSREYKKIELYPYQEKCIDKAIAAFKNGHKKFLVWGKCRSGKSIMCTSVVQGAKFKLSVVCSRFKSPKQSWQEDIFKFFPKVKYISIENKGWELELEFWKDKDVHIMLWGTVQSLVGDRIEQIKDIMPIDCLIFDEAHVGSDAKQFVELQRQLQENVDACTLYVSGTAYKIVYDFPDPDTKFIYTYWDEQLDSMNGVFEKPRPRIRVSCLKYDTPEYKEAFGDDPDAVKNMLLLDDEGNLLREDLMADFVEYLVKPQKVAYKDQLHHGGGMMTAINRQKEAHALNKVFDKITPSIVVTSDTKKTHVDINNHYKVNNRGNVITAGANILGLTAERLNVIINLKSGNSREFWEQLIFRGGSGDKPFWDVIEPNHIRGLRSLYESWILARDHNPQLMEHSMTNFVDVTLYTKGHTKLTDDEIMEIIAPKVSSDIPFMIAKAKNYDLTDVECDFTMSMIQSCPKIADTIQKLGAGEDANNESAVVTKTKRENIEKTEADFKLELVKAILASIPLTMFYIMRNGDSVASANDVINSEVYPQVTGDHHGILSSVFDNNPKWMMQTDRWFLEQACRVKKYMIQDGDVATLDDLSVSSGIQQTIPLLVLDPMISKLKDTSQTLIHSDPSGSHTARLLEQDVNVYGLTVWDDCANHRNRVEYIDKHVTLTHEQPVLRPTAILANPPYQDTSNKAKNNKQWPKFLLQHVDMLVDGGDMCEVSPASFISTTGFGKKFLKLCSTIYNLKEIDYTADQYFSQNIQICSWHLTKEPYEGKTRVITDDGEFDWDLRDGVPVWGDKALETSILNKIANSNHPRIPLKMGQAIATEDYCDDGEYEVLHTGNNPRKTNIEPDTGDVLKFVVPYSTSYKKRFITNAHIGMLNVWCPITDEEEGERLSKIFGHPLIQLYIDNYKRTGGFTAAVKNSEVPDITDYDNLDTQFNFTEEEVAYLVDNNVIKE